MKELSTLEYTADNPVAGVFFENNYIRPVQNPCMDFFLLF